MTTAFGGIPAPAEHMDDNAAAAIALMSRVLMSSVLMSRVPTSPGSDVRRIGRELTRFEDNEAPNW